MIINVRFLVVFVLLGFIPLAFLARYIGYRSTIETEAIASILSWLVFAQFFSTVVYIQFLINRSNRIRASLDEILLQIRRQNFNEKFHALNEPIYQLALKIYRYIGKYIDYFEYREKYELSQQLAHDTKAPLAKISTAFKIISKAPSAEEKISLLNKLSPLVFEAIDHSHTLLNNIVNESSKESDEIQPIDLAAFVKNIVKTYQQCHGFNNFKISIDPDIQLASINLLDLQRLFENLIKNALEKIRAKDCISINGNKVGDKCIIEVCNSGAYIAEEKMPEIFADKRKENAGRGLGLHICQSLVENVQGRIWCESSKEQMRTSFFFELPVAVSRG